MMLKGSKLFLRALEPEDLDFLYQLENDTSLWEVGNTLQPYSKALLKNYLDNAHRDIFEVNQLRLVICLQEEGTSIGLVDLYDFDPQHDRAGLGIVIADKKNRGHGYAKEAIELMLNYAFGLLNLHQIYATISEDNIRSIELFEKLGFTKAGVRKDWLKGNGTFKDEYFYQFIHE